MNDSFLTNFNIERKSGIFFCSSGDTINIEQDQNRIWINFSEQQKKNIDKNRYISFNLINFWIFFLTFTTLTQKYFQWICLEKKVDRKLKTFNPNYDFSCIWKSITTLNQMIKDLHLEWMDLIIIIIIMKWRWTWYYHIIDIVTIFFKNSIHSTTKKKNHQFDWNFIWPYLKPVFKELLIDLKKKKFSD